jgi:uncharacterized membrane protein YhaH (DUF805 family)
LDEGTKFCANCGTRAGEDTGSTAQDRPAQTANNYTAPPEGPVQGQQINVNVSPPQYAAYNAVPAAGQKNAWQYFCGVWKKYAVFSGRARRAEYWWFGLFSFIISVVLHFIEGFAFSENVGLLTGLYGLAVLLPGWGVAVRRFHDVDKRAWWALVPIYGWLSYLVPPVLSAPTGSARIRNRQIKEVRYVL